VTAQQALAFAGFALVMAATPGPSNTLLTATAAQVGVVRALPALFGVAVGMATLILVVSLGLGALILATPAILLALRLAGTAVLLWLAWQIATSPVPPPTSSARAAAPAVSSAPATLPHVSSAPAAVRRVGFAGAAAFQWVNPKSWLASVSAATFIDYTAGANTAVQAATVALVFVCVALPSCFPWLAFGAALHRLLHSPRAQRTFNLTMGLLLALSSLALLFT
jgi:threonine/homoserine/homoserine lactone efflux protein